MVTIDITCDLMDEDETGYVWTFLREARDPSLIEPGAIVVAGDPDAPGCGRGRRRRGEARRSGRAPPRPAGGGRGLRGARPARHHARLILITSR